MSEERSEPKDAVAEVRRMFFLPFYEAAELASLDEAVSRSPADFRPAGEAFRQNLHATVSSVGIPASLASASVQLSHFERIHLAERIRQIPLPGDQDYAHNGLTRGPREKEAAELAGKKIAEFIDSEGGLETLRRDACRFLSQISNRLGLEEAASELLRSGAVLVWGTLEVLARDLFVGYLNSSPSSVLRLIQNPSTRKKFELKPVTLDLLAVHEFNLSRQMGNVLIELHELSDLATIKDVFGTLFPLAATMRQALDAQGLWILNQRRHLLVHRRGIVDSQYLENTKDNTPIGSRILVSPNDFVHYFLLVRDAGKEMLTACSVTPT